ncbi:MAG: ParB/RepB/Spo0J family partition protein [Bradyrhizobium sp.]|nr:MAG: ParB/RepB/Spo0J family partition protein [Bradyrhizobium sp.]
MADEATRHADHRPRLGRGLAALLGEASDDAPASARAGARKAPIEFLRPNPNNPRKSFREDELDELAASIKERGVIQPVVVRPVPRVVDAFEIIAGERRWRAAQRAGLHEIPIVVVEVGDREALELAIVENVQRADLNALEEAQGYAQLGADYGYAHADIARIVGKSRSHVANTLRLMALPEHCRALIAAGSISAGHGRALLAVADPDAVADRIVARGLSVRDVERLGERAGQSPRHAAKASSGADADTRALEAKLALELGAKVTVRHSGGAGELRVAFANFEQLDDLCRRLTRPAGR